MNRPQSSVCCLRAIYAVIDEQRQALCVALLAGNICWGKTFIIGLVQLGAVVDEQRQALCVAILAAGVAPVFEALSSWAPWLMSRDRHSAWPFLQAVYAGVQPSLLALSSWAPWLMSSDRHSVWPNWQAIYAGIKH